MSTLGSPLPTGERSDRVVRCDPGEERVFSDPRGFVEAAIGVMALLFHTIFVMAVDWGYGSLLPAACEILAEKKISELPVVDAAGHPLGLIDITDIVATSGPRETGKPAASGPTVLKLVKAPRRKPKKT